MVKNFVDNLNSFGADKFFVKYFLKFVDPFSGFFVNFII